MLFKALSVYRLQADLSFTKDTLEEALGAHKFVPCSALQTESFGWVSPYDDDRMVASVGGQHLIVLQVEKKKVPAALVKQKLAIRVAEIEDTEGRQVGRKEKKELKEAITDELLPTTPPKQSRLAVWVDTEKGRIAVGSASANGAELALNILGSALDAYPALPLTTVKVAGDVMREWLAEGLCDGDFELGDECELQMAEGGATVKYARHNLDTPDVKQHIEKGKGVVSLGMTWSDELRLSLFSSPVALQLKKLAFLDTDTAAEEGEDKNARIEGQLVLESGTYSKVIDQLVEAFGGLYTETA